MTLRLNRTGKPRRELSPAQQAANERSFRIFRLRGLFEQASLLTGRRREQAQSAIDAELALLGAAPHSERLKQREAVWARIAETDRLMAEMEEELPF